MNSQAVRKEDIAEGTQPPHPNYAQNTQALKPPKYNVAEGKKTKGEKIYDLHNYCSVGYGAVLGLSLVLTDFFKHGKGRIAWDGLEKTLESTLKSTGANAATSNKYASNITRYFFLTSGGTALMLPMLWAENNKSKLTYLANRRYAPEAISEDDPNKALTAGQILSKSFDENSLPQPVTEQPKHGLFNAAWRRGIGVATISLGWGPLSTKLFGNDKIYNVGVKAGEKLLESTGSESLAKLAKNERFKRYAGWTLEDGVNTVITAGILAKTNGAGKSAHKLPADKEKEHGVTQESTQEAEKMLVQSDAASPEKPSTEISAEKIHSNTMATSLDKEEAKNFKDLTEHASHADVVEDRDQSSSLAL